MDPLESLNQEIGEFEDFVDDFGIHCLTVASKMNDILSGRYKDVDLPKPKPNPEEIKIQPQQEIAVIPAPADEINRKSKPIEKIKSVSNGKLDYAKWSEIKEHSPPPSPKAKQPSSSETKKIAPKVEIKGVHQRLVQNAVDKARKLGKEEFVKHNFESSLKHFTEAIETSKAPSMDLVPKQNPNDPFKFLDSILAPSPIPVDPILYSNRALVYFKLGDFEKSLQDCKECFSLDPMNVKSLYRQSQCQRSMKLYSDCVNSLKDCISLLEKHPETQKHVSLKVCKEQLKEVELLKSDKEIELLEAGDLLKDPSSELLGHLLQIYSDSSHQNDKEFTKISSNIIVLLKSHTSMKHAFRLLGGFQSLTNFNLNINESWIDILLEACVDCNENIREFGEYLNRLVLIVLSNRSKNGIATKFFSFLSHHRVLLGELARLKDFTKQIGDSIKSALEVEYDEAYLEFLSAQCRNSYELDERFNISIEWLINYVLKRSDLIGDQLLLNLLFSLSKLENLNVKSVMYNLADEIVVEITAKLDSESQTTENTAIGLACIHNILFQSKRKHALFFKTPKFMALICKLLKFNQFHDLCLKIFNRLSHNNLNEITPYLIHLDWEKCKKVLELGINDRPKDLVGDWSQILAVFLKISPSNIHLFVKNGGLPVLTNLFKECTKDQVLYSRIIGNLALSLSVCAQNELNLDEMIDLGLLELVVNCLRSCHSKEIKKNLAILCARLCKNERGLEISRKLRVTELLYTCGAI
ncbi:hypothetical protein HDV06_002916 [Boothiomyces sp. JEL0866]|nr:hypothetical protein HDV06_002916 [Boothiomyces sp. JEL0866]